MICEEKNNSFKNEGAKYENSLVGIISPNRLYGGLKPNYCVKVIRTVFRGKYLLADIAIQGLDTIINS
jgi:hypothetical protein